jgi:phosphoglycolate phosphatase-like HAD superfamily hydrolase
MFKHLSTFARHSSQTAMLVFSISVSPSASAEPASPLPSWHDGTAVQAIFEFVDAVTTEGSPDYVPDEERIATFDNDGTLWAERPVPFQLAFVIDRVKALAPQHPEWQGMEHFEAMIRGDLEGLAAFGEKGLLAILAASHSGMTTDEFARIAADWLATARHPRFDRPYTDLAYQPMLELLAYLRANGFKTFIVSGGGIEFMRLFAERIYGIPPEQVVGSSGVVTFATGPDGEPVLVKEAEVEFVDNGPGKPVGIHRFIGRRPILAVGNSDGDLQMLQWTTAGEGRRLGLIIHHTDDEREWAYDREFRLSPLAAALDEADAAGWIVVDMKNDWKTIFPFEQ